MTRVYVPLTRTGLARLAAEGVLGAGTAFAVTPPLRSAYEPAGVEDEEELEYVAMTVAARASLTALDLADARDRRRIVVAADAQVHPAGGRPDPPHPAQVQLAGEVPLAAVASVHVDTADAHDLVDAAVRALPDLTEGDPAAGAAVDALEREDLAWYATQELGDVLAAGGTTTSDP